MEQIKVVDRYSALRIPYPDPATMCEGQCEGTGMVPVGRDDPNDDEGPWHDLWLAAEREGPADSAGYHFVKCPAGGGSVKKLAS